MVLSCFKYEGGNDEGRRVHDVIHRYRHNLYFFSFMYSTFRIKPYLVQIHENVVLFSFVFKPSSYVQYFISTTHFFTFYVHTQATLLRCHIFIFTLHLCSYLSRLVKRHTLRTNKGRLTALDDFSLGVCMFREVKRTGTFRMLSLGVPVQLCGCELFWNTKSIYLCI